MTRILGIEDLATVVGDVGISHFLDQLIARLRSALAVYDPDLVETHDRTGFHYTKPELGLIEWMPAMEVGRRVSIKTVGYHPTNPGQRGDPSVLATTSVYDTTDGRLALLCEATVLTALRTGAASAIATDVLADPEARCIGLVGCGAQAVTQAHAVSRVRPIDRIIAFDTDHDVAASLASRLADLDIDAPVDVVDDLGVAALMAEADIICTATTVGPGEGPVIPVSEHRPGLHINAVGADFPGKLEIPLRYLERALVCPDVAAQCLAEGESQQLEAADLGPDLATLVRHEEEYRSHRRRLTVFDSTGWALQDMVAAELIADHAARLGIGTDVALQPKTSDPYDPYLALRAEVTT